MENQSNFNNLVKRLTQNAKKRTALIDEYARILREKNVWTFNPGHTEWLPANKEEIKKAILQSFFLLKEQNGEVSDEDKMSHFGAYTELASFLDDKENVEYARKKFKEIENKSNYVRLADSINQEKLTKLNDPKYESIFLSIPDEKSNLSSEFLSKTDSSEHKIESIDFEFDKLKEELGMHGKIFHVVFGVMLFLLYGQELLSLAFVGFIILGVWLTMLSAVGVYGVTRLFSKMVKNVGVFHQLSFTVFEALYFLFVVWVLFKVYMYLSGVSL